MKLVVKEIKRETKEAVSIYFKNGNFFNKIKYKPGQFLTLYVPVKGITEKRLYSFSSNPFTDKDLKITVKEVENGLVSRYLCNEVKVGDHFQIEKPNGSFFVEPDKKQQKQYVLFAGGSGITPVLSIIKSVLTHEPRSKVLLVYANQNKEAIIFHDEICELSQQYPETFKVEHLLVDNPETKDNYHTGLASNELYSMLFKKHDVAFEGNVYMICGPFGFMEITKEILVSNNVKRSDIIVEIFKSPAVKIYGKDRVSDVELIFKGQTHQLKVPGNKSILSVAMASNIALPYSCRSGMCATCKGVCTSGDIEMTEGHFLPQSEVEKGSILTCISYPKSEKVTIEI